MNYDITFCSNTNCDKKCERNQKNIEDKNIYVSIGNFFDCEYWKGEKELWKKNI